MLLESYVSAMAYDWLESVLTFKPSNPPALALSCEYSIATFAKFSPFFILSKASAAFECLSVRI